MAQRTYEKDDKVDLFSTEDVSGNELTEHFPSFINFIPNPELMHKLYRRMSMIDDPIKELWAGFHVKRGSNG